MKYGKLGRTGMDVSRLCLGSMSFGAAGQADHGWTLDLDASRSIVRQAIEAGINSFDTANIYSDGSSEEILGALLAEHARRDEVVIATKVFGRTHPGPNGAGLSRKAIFASIDASLRRLKTDHVDLYQIHRFDYDVPVEETLEALHDVVKAGKALHIGACSMAAWQFAKMLHVSTTHGWTRFATMQNYVNLLYREEEREMLPLCIDAGIAALPWSPLARGQLVRPWQTETRRTRSDAWAHLYAHTSEADRAVVDAVAQVAAEHSASRAAVALAWLLRKPGVASPIVGVSKPEHLVDALGAFDVTLDDGDVARLEAPYMPHAVTGFQ